MTKAACPHLIPWPDGKACRICFDDREAEVERLRESNFAAETEAIRVVMDDATALRAEVERLRADLAQEKRDRAWWAQKLEAAEEACSRQELELHTLRAKLAEAEEHKQRYFKAGLEAQAEVERFQRALEQIDRETRSASDVGLLRMGSIVRAALRGGGE